MAEFEKKKHTQDEFNKGNKYVANDGVQPATINNLVENSLYTEAFVESLTATPDTTGAAQVGTPTVTLIDNPAAGIEGAKKFKFSNLKGAAGKSIIPAENGNQTITYEQLKAYAEATSETYTISNSLAYNVGDVAIISYAISDRDNTRGSVFVKVTSWGMTSITGQGLGMSVAGEDVLFYNGYLEFSGGSIEGIAQNVVGLVKANFNRGPEEDDYFSLVIKTTKTQDGHIAYGENGTYFCLCKISNVPEGDTCTANVNYYVKINGADGADGITPLVYKNTLPPTELVIGYNYEFVTTSFVRANAAATPIAGEVFSAIVESDTSAAYMGLFQVNSSTGTETNCKLLSLTNIKGDNGAEVELRVSDDYIQWKYDSSSSWTNLISLATLKGDDGKSVELQKTTDYIQWRNIGDASWQNLVALSELKGESGENGRTPTIGENGHWYIGTEDTGVVAAGTNGDDGLSALTYSKVRETTVAPSVGGITNFLENGDNPPTYFNRTPVLDDVFVLVQNRTTTEQIFLTLCKITKTDSYIEGTTQAVVETTGRAGTDGISPHIGSNGNWFIGDTDTEVKATGADGITPHIGDNNNWFIGETDTNVKAIGTDGSNGEIYLFYSDVVADPQTPYVGKSYSITSSYFNRTPSVGEEFLIQVEQTSDGTAYLCNAKVTSSTSAEILTVMELGAGTIKDVLPVIYPPGNITLAEIKSRMESGGQNYYNAGNYSDFSGGDIGIVNVNISGLEEDSTVAGKLIILVTAVEGGASGELVGGRLIGYTYTPNAKIDVGIKQNEVINRSQSVSAANIYTPDFIENESAVWAKLATGSTETVYTPLSASTMETPTLPDSQDTCCRQIGNNAYIFSKAPTQLVKFDMSTEQAANTSFTMSPTFDPLSMRIAKVSDKIYVLYSGGIIEVSESGGDVSQTTYSWNGTAPRLYYTAVAEHGNYVYLFGGVNTSFTGPTNSIIKVDIINRTATTLPVTLPQGIINASAITSGENIYVFGGVTNVEGAPDATQPKIICKFNVETETISTLSCELPEPGYGMSLCAKGQSIYLIGGVFSSGYSNKIYEFNTLGETIIDTGVVCPNISMGGSCASSDSAIYKFGGDQAGVSGSYNAITKIILSSQAVSAYEYKRLALYSEINNGGGGESPSPSNIVDIGTVSDLTFGVAGAAPVSISTDIYQQLQNAGGTILKFKDSTNQEIFLQGFVRGNAVIYTGIMTGGGMAFSYNATLGSTNVLITSELISLGGGGGTAEITKDAIATALNLSTTQLDVLVSLAQKVTITGNDVKFATGTVLKSSYFDAVD